MLKFRNFYLDGGLALEDSYGSITDSETPLFTWSMDSDRPDNGQTACRVTVSCCGDRLWDSGWTETAEQNLRYAGAPLPEGLPLTLVITVRDRFGEEAASEEITFWQGIVRDWQGSWIVPADSIALEKHQTILFRRNITVREGLKHATLYCCGLGYHQITVNGSLVDDARMDPAFTCWQKLDYYTVLPGLEEDLTPGENVLAVQVADGWRNNVSDTVTKMPEYSGRAMLNARLVLFYADGSTETIVTDEGWLAAPGHVTASIFNGETYDARRVIPYWDSALTPSEEFLPARIDPIGPGPDARLMPAALPPVLTQEEYRPIDRFSPRPGVTIFDFGQNMAGVASLRLPDHMPAGQTITIRFAELVTETTGDLYTAPLRSAKATDTYIASGDERDLAVWTPDFTYHGFRYAEVTGMDCPTEEDILAIALHNDIQSESDFRCGSALATQIHRNTVMTEKSNIHSIMTDCPQRDERMGWMNDATVRFESTPYSFDVGRIFPKIIRDIRAEQDETGAIGCTAPFSFYGLRPGDAVCSSYLIAGLQHWLHCGDRDLLAESFDGWAAWEKLMLYHSDEELIVRYSFYGDWASPAYACDREEGAVSGVTPGRLMSTGYSYFNCKKLAEVAALLGRSEDERFFAEKAGQIKAAYLAKWWNPETAMVATGSQACQAFTLWLGLLDDPEDQRRAAKVMRDDLVEKNYRFTTGNLCTRYLLDMLAQYGYADEAWTLLTREEYPSYGFMIQNEATTIWERFELKENPGMNSHNHPMYGAVDYWFYARLCGIRPTEPGWNRFTVAPVFPEKLSSAQASVDTIRGRVSAKWVRRYGSLTLYVTVPFGCTADVHFDGAVHTVGSGSHLFSKKI